MSKMFRMGGLLLMVAVVSWGCGGRSADDLIKAGEKASHNPKDYPQAEKLLREFLKRFPDDARGDVALIALARILQNQDRPTEAVAVYEKVLEGYPGSPKADEAQFMIGYIYDAQRDYDKARVAYQKVIEKFPHSEFLDDAKVSLEHLGKSPEQWLAEMKPDTVAAKK